MRQDLRGTAIYEELRVAAEGWFRPGSASVCDAVEHAVSPDGSRVAFAGPIAATLDASPAMRICVLECASRELTVIPAEDSFDRAPGWSKDGARLYFLSDRESRGVHQAYVADPASGAVEPLARVPGTVEALRLSPDGSRLLLVVAGLGADLAGAQGGVGRLPGREQLPGWMPEVEPDEADRRWRSAWMLDLGTGKARPATRPGTNVWEACWYGDEALAVVASDDPDESCWYSADVRRVDLHDGSERTLYRPRHQAGWLCASPSGHRLAFAEAVCSDRLILAGDLTIVGGEGEVRHIDTRSVDVAWTAWRDDSRLVYAGVRGLETVVGEWTPDAALRELWISRELTLGPRFGVELALVPGSGSGFVATTVGFAQPPTVVLWDGTRRELVRFGPAGHVEQLPRFRAEPVAWHVPDGLEIEGWLVAPATTGPHPLVLEIHGGPIFCHRPRYVGTTWQWIALLRRGYAVLLPNPRGSSGRGQAFAASVIGDMGGADACDLLSGIDHLVATGDIDEHRLAVTGVSYGGYMSAWLITQDGRFRAAVPVSPVTDWVSQHLTSHAGSFCETFLGEPMTHLGGRYFTRSPVLQASRARTPTLVVCGERDRNTPPGQAVEFHHALRQNDVESVLVRYPLEGHAIRGYPAVLDFAARLVAWFVRHVG